MKRRTVDTSRAARMKYEALVHKASVMVTTAWCVVKVYNNWRVKVYNNWRSDHRFDWAPTVLSAHFTKEDAERTAEEYQKRQENEWKPWWGNYDERKDKYIVRRRQVRVYQLPPIEFDEKGRLRK